MICLLVLVLLVCVNGQVCAGDELVRYRTECEKQAHEEANECTRIWFDEEQCSCTTTMDFKCLASKKKINEI